MSGWTAFIEGLRRVWRYPQVSLLLLGGSLFSALCLALLPAASLLESAHRPAIAQAAEGLDLWMLTESLLRGSGAGSTLQGQEPQLSAGLKEAVLLGVLTLGLLPLFAWLPAAFLNGGALLTLVEAPAPFNGRRFLWGCWRWWAAFALLEALNGLAWLALLIPLIGGALTLAGPLGIWAGLGLLPLGLALLLWTALVDLTHIYAVQSGSRNILRAFVQAFKLALGRPWTAFSLYALAMLALAALHALFRLGILPLLPLAFWPLVLLAQQSFILLRLALRLGRLAGGAALVASLAAEQQELAARPEIAPPA